MNAHTKSNPTEHHATIKLGIVAHAKWFSVDRQRNGATPLPTQMMIIDGLPRFVAKQRRLAREGYTCYQAGVFGYHLRGKLAAMGVI